MGFINTFKTSWKKGFDYKGKSTRKEFIEFSLIDLGIKFLLPLLVGLTRSLGFSLYEKNLGMIPELVDVIGQLLNLVEILYIGGSLFVITSLTIRCLRNAKAKWQWVFLHFIPFGFVFIYFFPLKSKEEKIN